MDEADGDGAFADGGGDALDVAGANVAHGKNAGKAGFEHLRAAVERPRRISVGDISVGSVQPARLVLRRPRSRPVRMKPLSSIAMQPLSHSVRGDAPAMMNMWRMSWTEFLAGGFVQPRDCVRDASLPSMADDFGFIVHLDGRIFLDALNKIARHGVG